MHYKERRQICGIPEPTKHHMSPRMYVCMYIKHSCMAKRKVHWQLHVVLDSILDLFCCRFPQNLCFTRTKNQQLRISQLHVTHVNCTTQSPVSITRFKHEMG